VHPNRDSPPRKNVYPAAAFTSKKAFVERAESSDYHKKGVLPGQGSRVSY
jgi:hypothetical protein